MGSYGKQTCIGKQTDRQEQAGSQTERQIGRLGDGEVKGNTKCRSYTVFISISLN